MRVCDLCAILVDFMVKFLNHKEHEGGTKYTNTLNIDYWEVKQSIVETE
jgi:hypothetical protein